MRIVAGLIATLLVVGCQGAKKPTKASGTLGAAQEYQPTIVGGVDDAGTRHIVVTDYNGYIIISNPGSSGSSGGGGGPVTIAGDGGTLPVVIVGGNTGQYSHDSACYVCCGTAFTAIPACGAGQGILTAQNFGPNTVIIYPDGGLLLGGWGIAADGTPTTTVGGNWTANENGVIPYGCASPAGAQTDGGCTAIHWNY
jgi:hypothetical protein